MRVRFWLVGALAATAVAGCSGAPHPGSSASAPEVSLTAPTVSAAEASGASSAERSSSRPPSTERKGTAPSLPTGAQKRSADGAFSFANFFVAALSWSTAASDPTPLRQNSTDSCGACRKDIDALQQAQQSGLTFEGGQIRLRAIEAVPNRSRVKANYAFEVTADEEPIIATGPFAAPSTVAAGWTNRRVVMYVTWQNGRWKVAEIGLP